MCRSNVGLISAVICCTVVAAAPRPSAGQGVVVSRLPVCAPPPVCPANAACVAPRCFVPTQPEVVRSSSRVRAELVDHVLRYEVTETFVNRGARLGEADYLFPLPAGAAFQDLKLSINGELVAGEVLDAPQARGVYEEIVRRQRDPALVEWMGMGLLHARIFPILAGEEKSVVVRFQTVPRREGDALRIDYSRPGSRCQVVGGACPAPIPASGGIARSGDNQEYTVEPRSEFMLSYRASDGFGTPYSPTHSLATEHDGDMRSVRIEGDAPDITILLPIPHPNAAAVSVLPYATGDGPGFALITVSPPVSHAAPTPRDVTFVLDVSGSMSGRKIEQARAAGRQLLSTLTPRDRFRLIDFSTDVRTFRDAYETATPDHVREAQRYLDELEADGATNIEGALRRALEPSPDDGDAHQSDTAGRLSLVLFITDGEPTIGQRVPGALVEEAAQMLGHARLFTFGLGSDVNTSLLEQLALRGRGTAQFVRPDESVERAVSVVAHRLTDPVITDVALHVDGVRLTQTLPETMVDLFAGQDLVLLTRYQGSGRAHLQFTGRTPSGPIDWASDVTFPERERANPFVARLWATQRIGYLEAARHNSGASPELDEELRSLGERFGIPTELTSYLVREPAVAATPLPNGQFGVVPGNAGARAGAFAGVSTQNAATAAPVTIGPVPYSGPTRHIVARALDAESQSPVTSAAVIAPGTTSGANTRDDGTASFDVPANATSVTVRRIGYVPQTIPLQPGQTDYTVDLKKDVLMLEAQVVTGVSTTVSTQNSATAVNSIPGTPPPMASFERAKAAAAQRAATTLAAADSTASLAAGASGGRPGAIEHAGDRTFVQHDSVWTDTRFHAGLRTVQVQAFSPAYFALLQAVPDLRAAFALGDRVVVAGRQVAVEVTPAGATQLSDSDVAAVQSAW